MKVGDKVICKKSLKKGDARIKMCKNYIIENYIILYQGKLIYIKIDGMNFHIIQDSNIGVSGSKDFSNYFYTEKEARKLKLEKINDL